MTEFLDQTKLEIRRRLTELKPLVDEYQRLEAAATALGVSSPNGAEKAPRRARSTGARQGASRIGGRRGRPKGSGARSKQALDLVAATPGITIAELAHAMGIKQNYLYRVLPALASDGLVTKKGRGWHAKPAATQDTKPAAPKAVERKTAARKTLAQRSAARKTAARKKTTA